MIGGGIGMVLGAGSAQVLRRCSTVSVRVIQFGAPALLLPPAWSRRSCRRRYASTRLRVTSGERIRHARQG